MRVMFLLLIGGLLTFTPAWAQADLALYRVQDVTAVMTAPSAAQARDEAIIQAQHQALAALVTRLGVEGAADGLDDETVGALVQAFELQKEHASAGRYVGTFTIQFRPMSVRALLDKKGMDYTATQSHPVVILPVLRTSEKNVLWEESTIWHDAWQTVAKKTNLVPIIVPSGDLTDIATISTREALSGDSERLKRIVQKYEASGVVVAVLTANFDVAGELEKGEIEATRYDMGGKETEPFMLMLTKDAMVAPEVELGEAREPAPKTIEVLTVGAQKVIDDMTNNWKQKTREMLAMGPVLVMPVTVRVPTLGEWTRIKHILSQIPTIVRTNVVTMTRGLVHIELAFKSDIPSLKEELEAYNLELDEDEPGKWELQDDS